MLRLKVRRVPAALCRSDLGPGEDGEDVAQDTEMAGWMDGWSVYTFWLPRPVCAKTILPPTPAAPRAPGSELGP